MNTSKFELNGKLVEISRLKKISNLKVDKVCKKFNLDLLDLPESNSDFIYSEQTFDYAILFSGGYDSLSLALRHLEKGEKVALLSICLNPHDQYCASITAEILKKCYPYKVSFYKIFSNPVGITKFCEGTEGLVQQPICTFFTSFMPRAIRNSIKALECAYVLNDDAVSYLDDIRRLYSDSFKFRNFQGNDKFPPIKFPLIKTCHSDNIDYVSSIEEKFKVIFLTFSADWCFIDYYKNSKESVLFVKCDENSDKPNKKCDVEGYIIIIHEKQKKNTEKIELS